MGGRRITNGQNHGRRSRKSHWDCTICHSCRWTTSVMSGREGGKSGVNWRDSQAWSNVLSGTASRALVRDVCLPGRLTPWTRRAHPRKSSSSKGGMTRSPEYWGTLAANSCGPKICPPRRGGVRDHDMSRWIARVTRRLRGRCRSTGSPEVAGPSTAHPDPPDWRQGSPPVILPAPVRRSRVPVGTGRPAKGARGPTP